MQPFYSPNDPQFIADSDSQSIQNAVDAAANGAIRTVRIPRVSARSGAAEWCIDKAILLPSNITIVLEDCHLTLAEGIYDNIFRNKNMYTDISRRAEGRQTGIRIIGEGDAILDGGRGNDLRERTSEQDGRPNIRFNHFVFLHNVTDYVLENFSCHNLRYWAINQTYCTNGRIENIRFNSGELIPNQDGIDIRVGCSNIYINNISGRTGDDVIALSGFGAGGDVARLSVEGMSPDIHDITIKNVFADTNYSLVVLRNTDGVKIYRIWIENIRTTDCIYGPRSVVRIGENLYFRDRTSVIGETYDITVRGVYSLCRGTIFIGGALMNSHISDVYADGTSMSAISTFAKNRLELRQKKIAWGGATMENVVIENVHYSGSASHCDEDWMNEPGTPFSGCALDFRRMRKDDYLKNVVFRDIFSKADSELFMACDGLSIDIKS